MNTTPKNIANFLSLLLKDHEVKFEYSVFSSLGRHIDFDGMNKLNEDIKMLLIFELGLATKMHITAIETLSCGFSPYNKSGINFNPSDLETVIYKTGKQLAGKNDETVSRLIKNHIVANCFLCKDEKHELSD